MSLQTTTNINVDFYDKKYIMLNAKQYDSNSRWIAVTCYNNGDLLNLSTSKHTAYIRYRKADGYGVLNSCRINHKSEVLVELTEQMLAAEGICYVDLIIVNKGKAIANIDTGEIVTIDGSAILSTMAFCINVYEAAIDNSVIESSYEFDKLNKMLASCEADYKEVIQLARSYAIGDAEDVRENEDYDNSKYYSQMSKSWAIGDLEGSTGVKDRDDEGIDNAEYYSRLAKSYAKGNLDGDTNTKDRDNEGVDNAEFYSRLSKSWAKGDLDGDTNTRDDEGIDNAHYYSQMSKSYAMGGTGLEARDNEDINNAEYYSRLSMSYAKGGTNIAERNNENENENVDNAEYYSRLAKSYTMGDSDGSTNTRDNEGAENAKTYMETSLSHAITSQRYATGGTDTVDGEDTDNSKYYSQMSKSYAMGDADGVRDDEDTINAKAFMENSLNYATISQRYAVGGTDTVENEDIDNAEYYYKLARSYTKGDVGLRDDEDKDNALYYCQSAKSEADKASISEDNAQLYMDATKTYMDNTETYMNNASDSADSADISKENAAESANRAAEIIDSISLDVENIESNAKIAEENAIAAEESATLATGSADRASVSENNAYSYMQQTVAVTTNANNLYDQIQDIATLNGALSLKGTVEFAELATLKEGGEVKAGDLYYVSNAFTTDDTFKETSKDYGSGTYVYFTSDGYWDCLETSIVTGIFSNTSNTYLTGNIRLVPEDIGAVATENVATIDEVKEFLSI